MYLPLAHLPLVKHQYMTAIDRRRMRTIGMKTAKARFTLDDSGKAFTMELLPVFGSMIIFSSA